MDNQHRQITGYRELTQAEIDGMNALKSLEILVLKEIDHAQSSGADPRWCSVARTGLQQGFMAAGRAVARPDGY